MSYLEKYKKIGKYEKIISLILFISLIIFGLYIVISSTILYNPVDKTYAELSEFLGSIIGGGLIAYSLILGIFLLSSYKLRNDDKSRYTILSLISIFLGSFYVYFDLKVLFNSGISFIGLTFIFLVFSLISYIALVIIKIISIVYKKDTK